MVRGMTAAELVQHFSCGKSLPGFYVYDPASRIAFTPADCFSEVPCPIEFIARYHPKHVFESRSSPTISELNKAVARWEHRTRWWIYHKLQGDNCFSEGGWSWLEDRKLKRNFPCNHPLPVEWDRFFAIFRACALEKCRAVRSKLSNRRRSISNLNGVVRLGLLMLAESRWGLPLTDKDGGHALRDRAALTEAINATLDRTQTLQHCWWFCWNSQIGWRNTQTIPNCHVQFCSQSGLGLADCIRVFYALWKPTTPLVMLAWGFFTVQFATCSSLQWGTFHHYCNHIWNPMNVWSGIRTICYAKCPR